MVGWGVCGEVCGLLVVLVHCNRSLHNIPLLFSIQIVLPNTHIQDTQHTHTQNTHSIRTHPNTPPPTPHPPHPPKALQIELARNITGQQFVDALNEALEPRLRLMGQLGELEQFKQFFINKQLDKGTNIAMLIRAGETLDVLVTPTKEGSYAMVGVRGGWGV